MRFVLASPALGLALLAGVLLLIVLLHRLKPRRQQVVVPSLALWQAAAKAAGRHVRPWGWFALALSLAIGTLLVLPLTRPELQGAGDGTRRIVVVVDSGPSMAARTRDGRTRWQRALGIARGIVRAAPGTVLVVDTMGQAPSGGFVPPADALQILDRLAVVRTGRPAVPDLLTASGLEVHIVTDGVSGLTWPEDAAMHSVFEPADNVAVIGLVARRSLADRARLELLVQVVNTSLGAKSVRLGVRGEDGFALSRTFGMAAGERIDATFDLSGFEGGVLAAAASAEGDALADDDIAYTAVPRAADRTVALVTAGNPMLADALGALPGVRVDVVPPSRYGDDLRADVFVFDDFTPAHPPSRGAVLFRPSAAAWLPRPDRGGAGRQTLRGETDVPLGAMVRWDDLAVTRTLRWKQLPADVRTVVRSADGAVVLAGAAQAPWVAVGFRSGDSNLPLQGAFPVFLAGALDAVAPEPDVLTRPLGPVRVPVRAGVVRNGRGDAVPSRHVGDETLFDADRTELYTVRGASGEVRVAAMPLDPAVAELNRTPFRSSEADRADGASLPLERWAFFALFALGLLCIDWAVFARRRAR